MIGHSGGQSEEEEGHVIHRGSFSLKQGLVSLRFLQAGVHTVAGLCVPGHT